MFKTIWKYELVVQDKQTIMMPRGAEILCVQMQDGIPYVWALVNPSEDIEAKQIEVFGTGHNIGYDTGIVRNYIGTFQMQMGNLVFHVFERID